MVLATLHVRSACSVLPGVLWFSIFCNLARAGYFAKVTTTFLISLFTLFIYIKKIAESCGYVGLPGHSSPYYRTNSPFIKHKLDGYLTPLWGAFNHQLYLHDRWLSNTCTFNELSVITFELEVDVTRLYFIDLKSLNPTMSRVLPYTAHWGRKI